MRAFAIGARPTVADISMMAYLHYPADETGYDLATSHPAINGWLGPFWLKEGWFHALLLTVGALNILADCIREASAGEAVANGSVVLAVAAAFAPAAAAQP